MKEFNWPRYDKFIMTIYIDGVLTASEIGNTHGYPTSNQQMAH
jgi:hypothetical protein